MTKESPESIEFRKALVKGAIAEVQALIPDDADHEVLAALVRLAGAVAIEAEGGRIVPLLEPREEIEDYRVFDRAVCAAGLRDYFRPATPSDLAKGRGTPYSIKTGRSDPALPPPAQPPAFVRVVELMPGARQRYGISALSPESPPFEESHHEHCRRAGVGGRRRGFHRVATYAGGLRVLREIIYLLKRFHIW